MIESVQTKAHGNLYKPKLVWLEESSLIASDFFQTFWDFGSRRKLIFFPLPLVNFTAEKLNHLEDIKENMTSYGNHN